MRTETPDQDGQRPMKGRQAPVTDTSPFFSPAAAPTGAFVELDGEIHYRIAAYDRMEPFLVSLPSDGDLWMFITSGGGLTAGRVDADGAFFPYLTVDRLHEAHHHTGPVTLLRVTRADGTTVLWEPFAPVEAGQRARARSLYKNTVGNRLVFEEIDHELGLAFRYAWAACDEFGWVRSATLTNVVPETRRIEVLDGLRNVLPCGAPLQLYQQASNLVDAYRKSEIDAETGLGIFCLTAGITDRAEALEVLRANTVWCCGLEGARIHLDPDAVAAFRQGRVLASADLLNGARGSYLVSAGLELAGGAVARWHQAADTGLDHLRIAELRRFIRSGDAPAARLDEALARATDNLRRNVASADGLQLTGRDEAWSHHFANVLFNNMRGGVFAANYDVPVADLADFLQVRNTEVAARHAQLLGGLTDTVTIQDLRAAARAAGDPDLERLCLEYLPLHFGRRHGDPSRPWNRFAIRVRDRDGGRALNYEGNWRDIFQNWEALATAFPGFLPNIVAKFVNASTVDGYNPYRISREGVDWEVVTPEDPWSNIGYWGDHQIIYLLKLLEHWDRHDPDALTATLAEPVFSYADVPYRLKPYAEILRDPRATIDFDEDLAARIDERVARRGSDGRLVTGPDGAVHHATLLEKLLVPALAKISNLIPDAGIWMNTQRPEWNDANNALAGGGVSVVTLCYLRRYLTFLDARLAAAGGMSVPVAAEVVAWLTGVQTALEVGRGMLQGQSLAPADRRRLLDALGGAYSDYRETVYARGFSGCRDLPVRRVRDLCRTALAYLDWGVAANRRPDGLYHTYNVAAVDPQGDGVEVTRLQEMLEGQVAVLSSGVLSPAQSLEVVASLFASSLYRPQQRSFMLYPERELPRFLERNVVPGDRVRAIGLLTALETAENRSLLARDADGTWRFHGDFRNAHDVAAALDRLADRPAWREAVARDRQDVLELFEAVFRHRSYTGRSGTMYGYEGLGCIYWHMVAKLLLAVQENFERAEEAQLPADVRDGLAAMYHRVRDGIGYRKSVPDYGAFPTDPYSHTPAAGGARQPGMTGQVKEEILTRRGELGIRVQAGALRFAPRLLEADEFLEQGREFTYYDPEGRVRSLDLKPGSLAFTLCQVPVVYELAETDPRTCVVFREGAQVVSTGGVLDAALAREIFARSGRIERIRVGIRRDDLLR